MIKRRVYTEHIKKQKQRALQDRVRTENESREQWGNWLRGITDDLRYSNTESNVDQLLPP